jgi:CUE domain
MQLLAIHGASASGTPAGAAASPHTSNNGKATTPSSHSKQQQKQPQTQSAVATSAVSAERLSQISQVTDILPDVGQGFVNACLDYYQGKLETVLDRLLTDNLDGALSGLDRSLALPVASSNTTTATATTTSITNTANTSNTNSDSTNDVSSSAYATSTVSGHASLRRTVFDGDEFDRKLNSRQTDFDRSQLWMGKRDRKGGLDFASAMAYLDSEEPSTLPLSQAFAVDLYGTLVVFHSSSFLLRSFSLELLNS